MNMEFTEGDVLLLVDIQNDFCPGGNLPIEKGDEIIPFLNPIIKKASAVGIPVFLSRDFHPRLHPSFKENGGKWPVHCIQDTEGARFHPDLNIPDNAEIVSKGTRFDKDQYSAFDDTGLGDLFKKLKIKRVFVAGLALDVCVKETAVDSVKLGFKTYVLKQGTRPVSKRSGEQALNQMKELGIEII